MKKPILCIDFDGVIHSYEKGWQDGSIYGTITPGFWDWAIAASRFFQLVVYSSRSKDVGQIEKMKWWMADQWVKSPNFTAAMNPMPHFEFAHDKPPAFLTIDDRAILFDGNWSDPCLAPELLIHFKPWNARNAS
jgi:hypothetical protein